MLSEAFEDVRTSHYYYCATLLVYESIFVLSILTYLQTLDINNWSIEERLNAFRNTPYSTSLSFLAQLVYFTATKLYFCSHWITNTIAHISLCRWEISGVRKHWKPNNNDELNRIFLTYRGNQNKINLIQIENYLIVLLRYKGWHVCVYH